MRFVSGIFYRESEFSKNAGSKLQQQVASQHQQQQIIIIINIQATHVKN